MEKESFDEFRNRKVFFQSKHNFIILKQKEKEKKMKKIWNFIKDEDGLELTEYAVIGALIVIAVSAAVILLRAQIINAFDRITTTLATAN
jgi:Flp pilus assembly pilin Flp